MAAEGVVGVEDGEGFGVDLFVDGENGGVERGGGCGEGVGAVGVWGWVVEEMVVDLLAQFEGEIEEVGHCERQDRSVSVWSQNVGIVAVGSNEIHYMHYQV